MKYSTTNNKGDLLPFCFVQILEPRVYNISKRKSFNEVKGEKYEIHEQTSWQNLV